MPARFVGSARVRKMWQHRRQPFFDRHRQQRREGDSPRSRTLRDRLAPGIRRRLQVAFRYRRSMKVKGLFSRSIGSIHHRRRRVPD